MRLKSLKLNRSKQVMIPSRRKFVATLSVLAAALAVPQVGWALKKKKKKKKSDDKAAGKKLMDITADDPQAKQAAGLNYVADVQEAIKKGLAKEKMGVAAAKQNCANCVLVKKEGDKYACQLFSDWYVHEKGWCTTWSKKG